MRRFIFFLMVACGCSFLGHAELTNAQKQALFLKSKTSAASTTSSSSSIPKKKKTYHSASSSSHQKKHHSPSSSTITPPAHEAATQHLSTSQDVIIPIAPHASESKNTNPVITIEKSGILEEQAPEPTPKPQAPSHGWGWFFGDHHSQYHYLSDSVRRAIDRAPVRHGRWKYIVVHNSGTREGNARIFDVYHRRVRKMVNGLAYHFVIGNGTSSGDGEIEIGHRWTAQLNGGHVASDYLNDISLGICLVGDYNRDQPTRAQIGALNELIAYLRQRVGSTQGHHATVYAHKEINPRPTDCPGKYFPYHWLHQVFGKGS
jgi:hypothetical protein